LAGVEFDRETKCIISNPFARSHVSPHRAFPVYSYSKSSIRQYFFIRPGPLRERISSELIKAQSMLVLFRQRTAADAWPLKHWWVVKMSVMSSSSVAPEADRKSALIVEGGAMRGAWAAGVLAFLYERGLNRYDMVYAASSGACSAAFFVAGMVEPGLTIWREHACRIVRKTNILRRKPIIDLAYLVDHLFRERALLSVEAIQNAPTRFCIVLTDCHTGEPVYFHARDERIFEALRASSSMAFATRGFDYVDGHPYADGGVADPIPIQRVLQEGATDITVVLTHRLSFRLKATPRFVGRLAYPQFPAVASAWTGRQHVRYNAAMELIRQPPEGVRVQVFSPLKPMPVRALTAAKKRIQAALSLGRLEASQQIAVSSRSAHPQKDGPALSP
jgi:predicted patatin/cPLA2 family phospholipase